MSETTTIENIVPLTDEENTLLDRLLSDEEQNNGVSQEESTKRTSLIFKRQANSFVARVARINDLLNDDIEDTDEEKAIFEKMKDNYADQGIKNFEAYLENS